MDDHDQTISSSGGRVLDGPARTVLRFTEFAPPDDLADWIEGIGIVVVPTDPPRRRWRLIPDARARLWLPLTDGAMRGFRPAALNAYDVSTPPTGSAVMVRFAPWATAALYGERAGDDVNPPGWWARGVDTWVPPAATSGASYRAICEWVRSVIPAARPDGRATRLWRAVMRDPNADGRTLARSAGASPRTVRRTMRRTSGCSLRTARQLERLRIALRILRRDLERSWTDAALDAGYSDQSHLYRGFGRWVGMSPGRFFAEGHHHLNDVFARRVVAPDRSPPLLAHGSPSLRPTQPARFPIRDRRRHQRGRPQSQTSRAGVGGTVGAGPDGHWRAPA